MILTAWALLGGCGGDLVALDYLAVINVAPPHGALNVGPAPTVSAPFSAPLLPEALGAAIWLETAEGDPVAAALSYDDASWTVRLRPESALAEDTAYALMMTESVESETAGPLVSSLRSSFHTAASASAPDAAPEARVSVFSVQAACQPAVLDGRKSSDPEEAELTYAWTIEGGPGGEIVGVDQGRPELWADADGDFLLKLVVSDGGQESDAAYQVLTCGG